MSAVLAVIGENVIAPRTLPHYGLRKSILTGITKSVKVASMTTRSKPKLLCEPAATIVRELGGASKAAEIAGVAKVQVYRWMWSLEDGGTGGFIPSRRAQRLFEWARDNGKNIPAELFFERVA